MQFIKPIIVGAHNPMNNANISSSNTKNRNIENIIENKQAIYDLTVDKTVNKIGNGNKLEKFPLIKLPKYIQNNLEKFKIWID